jgi:hypothetical protein
LVSYALVLFSLLFIIAAFEECFAAVCIQLI